MRPLLLMLSCVSLTMSALAASAEEPAAPSPPAPANPPSVLRLAPAPPPPPAGEIWQNLVDSQSDYNARLGEVGIVSGTDPGFLGERGAHLFVQAGVYMLAPLPKHDHAVAVRQNSTGATTVADFEYGAVFAPRLVFGAKWDNGWGFRTAWLYFHEQTPTYTIFNNGGAFTVSSMPVPGVKPVVSPGPTALATGIINDRVSVGALLDLNVWDWEAFYQTQMGRWLVGPALGVRYATMSQNYNVVRGNAGTTRAGGTTTTIQADVDALQTGHRFDGFGPTFAMELVRPIGNTGLRFYATPRASVICGSAGSATMRFTELFETITPPVGARRNIATSSGTYTVNSSSIAMPVLEAELGAEWSREFGRHRAFVRCGMVEQEWFDAGDAIDVHGVLGFIGLAVTAGLVY